MKKYQSLSKWNKKPRGVKPTKVKVEPTELCNVVPVRLASIPGVYEWLSLHRSITITNENLEFLLNARYEELKILLKNNLTE